MKLSPVQSRALDDLMALSSYQPQTWTALESLGLVKVKHRAPMITAKGKSTISRAETKVAESGRETG